MCTDGMIFAADLVERARRAGADGAQAEHVRSESFEINFDTDGVTLLRSTVNAGVYLDVLRGGRRGAVSFSGESREASVQALAAAMRSLEAGLPDSANRLSAGPSAPNAVYGDGKPDREAMLERVLAHVDWMRRAYPLVRSRSCSYTFTLKRRSFCNSNGVRQAEHRGSYRVALLFAARRGTAVTSFNHAGATAFAPFQRIADAGAVARLLDETMRSFEPRPVPGKFTGDVIVSPACMAVFTRYIAGALDGYALLAGTTPYRASLHSQVASPCFTLLNRPRRDVFPGGADFDRYGVTTRDLDVIVDGELREFLIDFHTAAKLDRPQTAGRTNFMVPGGEIGLDQMIANTRQGILLSRFAGGHPNDNLQFSGVAKNSFYVRDGAIQYPLVETMVAGSLGEVIANAGAVSRETVNFGNGEFPYLATAGMTISGKGA